MREKKRCRWLALLLAVVMLLSVLPTAVFAARDTSNDEFYKIVHLDCGRKYFTKDWIIALINEVAYDGYNQLQLAFGNDGLRFLLNDMSFTANGTNYLHADVVKAVEQGNANQNSSGDSRYLTQSEMDEIIAAANAKGIEIVPLLNLPGHANAILDIAGDAYNASGSNNTLDVTSGDARDFGYAIFTKYVDYFAGKGCKFFNFGADEYANDASGAFSFNRLNEAGYNNFVEYINLMAGYIEGKQMTPRAFNDGLYYNNQTATNIDTKIQCCYWSNGWDGYSPAAASFVAGRGHAMINTHGDYYYVLGKDDAFTPGKTTTHDANLYTAAAGWSNDSFPGGTVSNPAGSMFCIWCDYPNAETETQIAANTRLVMRALSKKMDNVSIDNLDETVVPGGFNADGSLNVLDLTSKISGLQTQMTLNGTQTLNLGESATWTSSNENVITLASTARSVVSPSVVATAVGVGSATITAETDSTVYAATVTVAGESAENAEDMISSTGSSGYVLDDDGVDANAKYLIVYNNNAMKLTGNTNFGSTAVTVEDGVVTSNVDDSTIWKYQNGGFYNSTYSCYLSIEFNSLSTSSSLATVTVSRNSDTYTLSNTPYLTTFYLLYNNGWTCTRSSSKATAVSLYKMVEATYTVDPALQQQRITALTVSNDGYTDESWNAYQTALTAANAKLSEVQNATYNSESDAQTALAELIAAVDALQTAKDALKKSRSITVKYQTADGTVVKTETLRVAEDAASVTLQTPFSANDKTYAVNNPTLALTAATSYTVTVTEVQEDLSSKTLTVEFWITNQQVTANGSTSMEITADTDGVYSENGVLISDQVPAAGSQGKNTMVFWKGTRLDSDHHQTTDGGVDMTKSGNDFTYIRYWNGSWAYSADGKSWAAVADGDQIVAYYLQRTDVTDEITTLVVDWGPQRDNWSSGLGYLGTKYVLVDYSVKYESGEESPSSFPTEKSLGFHCDVNTKINGYYYRDLGMVRGLETKDYEIYMITLTPTSDDPSNILASTAAGNSSYSYRGTEVVAWAATEADLENSELGTYTSINGNYTYSIGGEPIVSGLQIYRQHGMKVTFYVRAKVTEDSLSVHYVDDVTKQEFYSYNIAVKSGTLFNENIGLADPWKGNLANGSVTNLQDKTQTVSADLSTMPAIGAQYRYSEYACKSVTRSENGKEVYLYYTFNNTHKFVIDFGLPLNITRENLGIEGNWTSAAVTGAKYGTATATIGDGVTYTPTRVLTEVETLQLTLTDSSDPDGSVTHQVYIYPASNVLYEDNFLTQYQPEGKTYAQWTTGPAESATGAVQSAVQTTLYGYDVAYVPEAGNVAPSNSMGSAWTIAGLSSGNGSQYLTTTFTGNGFDLLGTAGHNTGYVYVLLKPKDGSTAKLYVVDTSYVDGKQTTLTQVPLLHAEFDTQNTYDVTIRAAFRQGTAAAGSGDTGTQVSRAAAFSMSAAPTSLDSVYDMVDELFADGFEIDDVEYVYFDDASALAELENSSRATYAMSYALDSATAAATVDAGVNATTARPAGDTVTIDGFRVYRSTDNSAYSVSEHNEYEATYVNVAEAVLNGTTFTAFTENGNGNWTSVEDYHNAGGPKWEVYLNTSSAIAFKVNTTKPVQISARAIGDSAVMKVNNTEVELTSKTEMYYEVTPDSSGIVTIKATNGKLAIANIKIPAGTQTTALTDDEITKVVPMLLRMAAAPGEPDPEQPGTEEPEPTPVFTPETFKTRVNSIRTRNRKIVTLTITASTDVDHVVVNGKTYYPMNKLLVKWGLSKTYVFTIMDTAGASETRSFEIVAYNADGLASSTYTDAG